jgi:opacity protein-like surface antigen
MLVLTLLLAYPPRATDAQIRPSDFTFYLSSGLTQPVAPSALADGFRAGLNLGAGVGVNISYALEVNLYAEHTRLGLSRSGYEPDGGFGPPLQLSVGEVVKGGSVAVTSGRLNLQYLFAPSSMGLPYLTGGVRLQRLGFTQFEVGPEFEPETIGDRRLPSRRLGTYRQSAFGFNIGGGLQIPISYSAAFFVEPTYVVVYSMGDRLRFVSVRAGVALGTF